MPYCMVVENPDEGQEQWERINAHLRVSGPVPPDGQRLLIAGPANPGWRVVSVWDSLEAFERFRDERLVPACRETACPIGSARMMPFEIHTLVAGDLTGTPQPA